MAPLTIWLHAEAPAKPPAGAACNGCGVCCSAEPCPLGMVLSLRVRGRCRMLRFDADQSRYRCGLIRTDSASWHRPKAQALVRALVARWIGAGLGCDSSAQATQANR